MTNPPKGRKHGYRDIDENEWVAHAGPRGREGEFHWDVQHLDGRHTNVGPDGEVHHGPDNFP